MLSCKNFATPLDPPLIVSSDRNFLYNNLWCYFILTNDGLVFKKAKRGYGKVDLIKVNITYFSPVVEVKIPHCSVA